MRDLFGRPCTIDTSRFPVTGLDDDLWKIEVFDLDKLERETRETFFDNLGDEFCEQGWLEGPAGEHAGPYFGHRWVARKIPFAFIGMEGAELPDIGYIPAILFLDLDMGEGDDCPVLLGVSGEFASLKHFAASTAELRTMVHCAEVDG
jgi:hypothetical protein